MHQKELKTAFKLATDTLGEIFSILGFKHSAGSIWALLYLTPKPLNASQIKEKLDISTGTVSMSMRELIELQIVKQKIQEGTRISLYYVENDSWLMVNKIFKHKTRIRLKSYLNSLSNAYIQLNELAPTEPEADYALQKIKYLKELGQFALDLLDAFLARTRVEVKAARKWLRVSEKLGGEPLSRLRKRINSHLVQFR